MYGITSYATYIPWLRLTPDTDGWPHSFQRSVANFDEDAITMGVAAGKICLHKSDLSKIKALLFCSTSAPYAEKQNAAVIAAALNLPSHVLTVDLAGSIRSSTSAIYLALDMIQATPEESVLIISSDTRMGMARSSLDDSFGDGAAAILLGQEDPVAIIESKSSQTSILYDLWRDSSSSFVSQWEDRFVADNGVESLMIDSVQSILSAAKLDMSQIYKLAINAPNLRQANRIKRLLNATDSQLNTSLLELIGNTGCSMAIMELCLALDQISEKDQYICLSCYGDGVDSFLIKSTRAYNSRGKDRESTMLSINTGHPLSSYEEYATLKHLWQTGESVRRPDTSPPSVPAIYREQTKNIHFQGGKCDHCGYVQYPAQKICVNCQEQHPSSVVNLSSARAILFTYSMDYLAGTTDVPLVICTINFDTGGRMLCVMTDRNIEDLHVNMPLEMSFRKISEHKGVTSYSWKAMPIRLEKGEQA